MNETITTIVGNVVDEPKRRLLESGVSVTTFRVASTARRFDRVTNDWMDGDSLYLKVSCWRALADNTADSIVKGDPVVVSGKLYSRMYEVDGSRRAAYELQASALGFDLNRGVGKFTRLPRRGTTVDEVGTDGIPSGSAIDAYLDAAMRAPEENTEPDPFGFPESSSPLDGTQYGDDPFGPGTAADTGSAEERPTGTPEAAEEKKDENTSPATGRAGVPTPRPPSSRRRNANTALA